MKQPEFDLKVSLIAFGVGIAMGIVCHFWFSPAWYMSVLVGVFSAAGIIDGYKRDLRDKMIREINEKIPKG